MRKLHSDTKIVLTLIGLLLVAAAFVVGAGLLENASTTRKERAAASQAAEFKRVAQERIASQRPEQIIKAMNLAATDPAAGIKLLSPYNAAKDAEVAAALQQLEVALKKHRIAKAEEYLKAGKPGRASDELLAYQGQGSPPEVRALLAKAAAMSTKQRAEEQKQEMAGRKASGVQLGMTRERVLQSSWGYPSDINRTTNLRGVSEQWVYRSSGRYLYFESGILTTIQD